MRRLTKMALLVSVTTTAAVAADIGVTPTKLVVVDKLGAAGKAKAVFVAKDAGATKGAGEDVEQIGVRFDVAYGNGSAAGAFVVPAGSASGWLANKATVAKYVNKDAPAGPTEAKVAVIKPGKLLKLVGKGLGDVPLDVFTGGDPGAGGVETAYCVTNGAEEHCHCSAFAGCAWKLIAGGTGAKLVCKTGAGDPTCGAVMPPVTTSTIPTTTSTSSTTTTTTSSTTSTTVGCLATSGCFCDTGPTVIDTCTNLEWEKKDTAVGSGADAGNLRDVDNRYTWAGRCTLDMGVYCQPNSTTAATCMAQTGGTVGCEECGGGEGTCDVDPFGAGAITTIWDWIDQVNAANLAGHGDWRLATSAGLAGFPTGEPAELESIVDLGAPGCGGGSPCIDPIFGPTVGGYWSASTPSVDPDAAWFVNFGVGLANPGDKSTVQRVRAVRSVP